MKPITARLVQEIFNHPTYGLGHLTKRLRGFYGCVLQHPDEAFRQKAVKALYDFTTEAVALFSLLPEPELAREARNEHLLPVLAYPQSDSLKQIGDLVERLELGRSALIDMRAKGAKGRARFSLNAPVNRWAWDYLHRLLYIRKRLDASAHPVVSATAWLDAKEPPDYLLEGIHSLPPFSVASRHWWAEFAWILLLFDHNGHPEKRESLRRLGLDKAERGRGKKGSKTYERDIRDGIERSFKAAFSRLPARA